MRCINIYPAILIALIGFVNHIKITEADTRFT